MTTHRLPKHRPPTHPGEILNERRGVSTETGLLLAKASGTTAEFWLNAQRACDLWEALHGEAGEKLDRVERITG